jgi:hypothetical protein
VVGEAQQLDSYTEEQLSLCTGTQECWCEVRMRKKVGKGAAVTVGKVMDTTLRICT